MIQGKLRNRRVLIENEADASTLRNKGSTGRNLGEKLSLDLMTSLDLLTRKRIEITKGENPITTEQIKGMLSDTEKDIATSYHFLKAKGMRPQIKRGKLYADGTRILIFRDDQEIDFTVLARNVNFLSILDSEGNCLLYSLNKLPIYGRLRGTSGLVSDAQEPTELVDVLKQKGMRVASGFKFGSMFRIYEGSSSHARYLMNVGRQSLGRDIVAIARIAQSVRKTYVHSFYDTAKGQFKFFEIKWIRL